jgi:hypothetical protein
MPAHLTAFSGKLFMRVSTSEPEDPNEQRSRIAALVDDIAAQNEEISGVQLVQRAVWKLAGPIKIRVMDPDPKSTREWLEIPEIGKLSDGEKLTTTILLFCTLAQLRARYHGRAGESSGVLILDNPYGKANRVSFLELQREVARAMGFQLIYVTATKDIGALRALPNLIRLKNSRIDRNTGRRHVAFEREVVVGDLKYAEAAEPPIDGVRVVRKHEATSTTTNPAMVSTAGIETSYMPS